jgi:hypothetical protein
MGPAFSSTKQAAAFALLLLAILLSPVLVGKSGLPPREQVYSSIPWGVGAFPYLHDQIFEEKQDIDIAFMGSSPLWWGIDTPYVQQKLGEELGRPAVVRSLCWSWNGFDAFYFIAQDLLERRKVRLIVFCDLSPGTANTAHPMAPRWFRFAENEDGLSGLPLRSKASFYSSAILGLPRNLLGLLRPNLPAIPSAEILLPQFPPARNPALRLGSLDWLSSSNQTQAGYAPATGVHPSDVCVYNVLSNTPSSSPNFRFSAAPPPPMQTAFARKVAGLAREQGVKLVYLHVPKTSELGASEVEEKAFWPAIFQSDLTMLGIPGAKIFAGMSSGDISRLYFDFQHFNRDGQKYFTPVITPALVRIYENQTKP